MRGQPPSNRELRRERLVGNWGGASEHIGRRWEEVGLRALLGRVDAGISWPENDASVRRSEAMRKKACSITKPASNLQRYFSSRITKPHRLLCALVAQ